MSALERITAIKPGFWKAVTGTYVFNLYTGYTNCPGIHYTPKEELMIKYWFGGYDKHSLRFRWGKAKQSDEQSALEAYYDGGASAVYQYAEDCPRKFERKWTHCEPCDTETPTLKGQTCCAICSSERTSEEHDLTDDDL
jgi:hypothetical protein